jgi:hypothetical protein
MNSQDASVASLRKSMFRSLLGGAALAVAVWLAVYFFLPPRA